MVAGVKLPYLFIALFLTGFHPSMAGESLPNIPSGPQPNIGPIASTRLVPLQIHNQFPATLWVKDKDQQDNIINGFNQILLAQSPVKQVDANHTYSIRYYGLGSQPGVAEKTACSFKVNPNAAMTVIYVKPAGQYVMDAYCEIWDQLANGWLKRNR